MLEEQKPPAVARITLFLITLLLCSAVIWASVSSTDRIVVAQGKLVTVVPTIVVQPLETSIIRSIDAAVGDVVRAGQPLVTLDPTFSKADVDQQRTRLHALEAQVRRLEAELEGGPYDTAWVSSDNEGLQRQLYLQRRALYGASMENFDQQIASRTAALERGRIQEGILLDRLDTMAQIETARSKLYERETGSLFNLLVSRDARLSVDQDLAEARGLIIENGHELKRLAAEKEAFAQDFRRTTLEQLLDARGERDTALDQLKKMDLRLQMVMLSAPADSVVLQLAPRSVGSVVREAEALVTLVPLDAPLEADVLVEARDVGHLSEGQAARLKFDAYPFQTFGTADGTLRVVSRDAISADGGENEPPAFRARIALTTGLSREGPDPLRLLPGMSVTAEIKVGQRRVISYFLHPLVRGLDSSLKEP
ncbi:putative transmembrane HlyD type I secretion protein [Lutibaculum baratangense AMV1]|uniref:Membrane fusion protein (MFP) family protein n=1 Tax=Lutibaculum baratangense AMV1 TaxID=631454 RepID=V4T923_9HYPH|nr:putative transmembrane HlyD type I secretion protein [Lutibaculum baratangense AMV1]